MKKKLLSLLLTAVMTVIMAVPVFAAPGEYDQGNDFNEVRPETEITLSKPVTYTVRLPISLELISKEIEAEDTIEAYDIEKTQQTPTLTDITGQSAGKKIWFNCFPIEAKGLIDTSSVIKVTPEESYIIKATDEVGDTASFITKANVTDLAATSVKFKNSLNAGATDAYELPNDYDTTQTATGFIWVDDDDIDSASVYTGTIEFTISLEPNE